MKNTTINFIKNALEEKLELVILKQTKEYSEEYINQLYNTYKEFISIYGESIDVMILQHYKERLGVEDE